MWVILTMICFYNTHFSAGTPICFKDALLPLRYENDTSCILVMQQLARDLTDDMNNRLASMQMKCIKVKGENYKHKEIDKLPLFKPSNNKEVEGGRR